MKILIVSQYFWPEDFRINDTALGLKARGHDVTVLTGVPNYPQGTFAAGYGWFSNLRQDYHGVRVIRAPLIPRGAGGGLRLGLNYVSFALTASVRALGLVDDRFDVILVFEPSPITVGIPAALLGRLTGAPVMLWVQDLWPESLSATGAVRSGLVLALAERLVRLIYRGCDKILIQSEAFRASIEARGVASDDVLFLPNTAEDVYRPVELEADAPERGLIPRGFNIMFAGNVGAAQSFPTILAAAERLRDRPDIRWIVIGDGRQRAWVEAEIARRQLGSTVLLLGRRPVEAMPRFFALADALLVSLRREPIFALTIPSKVQSYLACGRPIVAALEGEGARVVAEAQAGFVCPPDDPEALARAVARLSETPASERARMGQRGRDFFERQFHRDLLLGRLEGWMADLTAGRPTGRAGREVAAKSIMERA